MSLEQLEKEKVSLSALLVSVDETILKTESELEASFTGDADTDKLSQSLAQLHTKRTSLLKAIESANTAIAEEQKHLIDQAYQADINIRKDHVKSALVALSNAVKHQEKLATELQRVAEFQAAANLDSSELTNQSRALVGRLANQFHLFGAINMAHLLPLLSIDDAERLQSKIV